MASAVSYATDAELIAAHAVEEIAKRHNFDTKAINQIKTAIVLSRQGARLSRAMTSPTQWIRSSTGS